LLFFPPPGGDTESCAGIDKDGYAMSKIELLRSRLKTDVSLKDLESLNDAAGMAKHVETILDQIKYLRTAVENTIELSKIKGVRGNISEGVFLSIFNIYVDAHCH
jgi:hypothetical protein